MTNTDCYHCTFVCNDANRSLILTLINDVHDLGIAQLISAVREAILVSTRGISMTYFVILLLQRDDGPSAATIIVDYWRAFDICLLWQRHGNLFRVSFHLRPTANIPPNALPTILAFFLLRLTLHVNMEHAFEEHNDPFNPPKVIQLSYIVVPNGAIYGVIWIAHMDVSWDLVTASSVLHAGWGAQPPFYATGFPDYARNPVFVAEAIATTTRVALSVALLLSVCYCIDQFVLQHSRPGLISTPPPPLCAPRSTPFIFWI